MCVAHITDNKLDYCVLGDVQLFIIRRSTHGVQMLLKTEAARIQTEAHIDRERERERKREKFAG